MRVDMKSFFTGERELLTMKMHSSPLYRARNQIGLCNVFAKNFPQYPNEVHPLTTVLFRGGNWKLREVTFPKHTGSKGEAHNCAENGVVTPL